MSLIRRNDEHWRENLPGLTFNRKLEAEIMQRHNQELTAERLTTRYKNLVKTGIAQSQNISDSSFTTSIKPNGKIREVGFNCADDLILDNFGYWLAGIIRAPQSPASVTQVAMNDITNTSRTLYTYSSTTNTFNVDPSDFNGTQIQLGSGNTAATRADYAVETALGNAPENTRFGTNAGSYAAGNVSCSGAVTAGGAGTVNEMGLFGLWTYVGTIGTFMLFHDILSAGVAYIAGDTLNASYSITL